jgi:hypothetical protein
MSWESLPFFSPTNSPNPNLPPPFPLPVSQAHGFAATGQLERLAELLQATAGACANVRDDELRTPLHWASFNGKSDAVQLLLRYGADLNAVDSRNVSPLMVACLNSHAATVALLLQCGARTDFRSTAGKTAESVASPDIQALLRRAPPPAASAPTSSPQAASASSAAPASNLPPLAVAAMRPAASPQPPSPSPRGPPMLQRTRAVSNNVAAASAAANPPSPAPALQPLQPGSAAAGARRALTASPVLAAAAVANNSSNNSSSGGDETAALRAQVGELSEKLQRANTQIAQLLERIAAERATNTRLHDRIRELGGVPPLPVGGPPLARHSMSESIDAPKGLSPRSAAAAAAERQRASPPGLASSTSPAAASPQPPPRVAPRARSNSPPVPRIVRGPPPPVGPRLPNVLASSPPPMAGGKRGSANSGVFEGQMDMDSDRDSDVYQTINDTSHYHSLAGVQLLDYGPTTAVADVYGSVPKSEASAGNNTYGTLPMPAQADLSHLYIMPQEDFF